MWKLNRRRAWWEYLLFPIELPLWVISWILRGCGKVLLEILEFIGDVF